MSQLGRWGLIWKISSIEYWNITAVALLVERRRTEEMKYESGIADDEGQL